MRRGRRIAALGLAAAFVSAPTLAFAQAAGDRSDAGVDADDARTDALLGTLNLSTPSTLRKPVLNRAGSRTAGRKTSVSL